MKKLFCCPKSSLVVYPYGKQYLEKRYKILISLLHFRTPLHEACQEGHDKVAKILLENAHNNRGEKFVNSMCEDRDDDGATPLLLVTFMCLSDELT